MGNHSLEEINDMYFDVLKEIGNIGAGNATTAISNMLSLKIGMSVPQVELMPVENISGAIGPEDDVIVGIMLGVEHDISGSMMFLMDMDSAHHLVNRLMGRDYNFEKEFDEMDLSALKEVGNIIASAYLSALSGLTNLTISPTVPYLAVDMAGAILSVPAIQFGMMGDKALLIETSFDDEVAMNGFFILMPEEEGYEKILTSLGMAL